MNLNQMLEHLIAQRRALDEAILALQRISTSPSSTRSVLSGFDGRRRRRRMSPEAKKRISEMMKKRWAERKRAKSA